jgi:hypothetical protein
MWMIANCKNGVSSYQIARDLKVTQKTAWFMLHRLRYAMHHGTITKMSGTIEPDGEFEEVLKRVVKAPPMDKK